MQLLKGNTPRWAIFFIDITVCVISLAAAYLIRFDFNVPQVEIDRLHVVSALIIGIRALSFFFAKTYAGMIRYTGTADAQRIFVTLILGSIAFGLCNLVSYFTWHGRFIIPLSIILIEFLATMFLLFSYRMVVKALYFEIKSSSEEKQEIIIFGAGAAGVIAKEAIDRDTKSKYKVAAFVDDEEKKANKKIEGVTVYHSSKLEKLFQEGTIKHIIISPQKISSKKRNTITELAIKHGVKVLNVPPVTKWTNGELSFNQMKKVKIEDLLGRDEIKLSNDKIKQQLKDRIILVTGAAGSIGSELVRQIVKYQPKKVILLDQAESGLYEVEFELKQAAQGHLMEVVVGDICNYERMENLFKTFTPQVVFHAAAYKHVPLMEENPSEAIHVNVGGTKNLVELSVQNSVEKFVMVSTDKAVNPTSVMGASKRIAEIFAQSTNGKSTTKFITTRFGNVLGSNGSVIPLFRKQIEQGGPITVTHPDITRYFMTIPEACQLVLEAGTMGEGGEIFIFDMGESVKIVDLAKKMLKLSGMELGKDIQIVYTGLRPGEKLYEELLNNKENTVSTHHPQIMVAKVREYELTEITPKIEALVSLYRQQDNLAIVKAMKELVPEYKSNNSVYEKLDSKIT